MIVVSDTSPISNLILINQLEILERLFQEVIVPPFVHQEILALKTFSIDLTTYETATWLKVIEPNDKAAIEKLLSEIDRGECEAIVLAKELNANLLLIDERLGTVKAKEAGLNTIGLLGILVDAKTKGLLVSIKPLIEALEDKGFWIGSKLKKVVLDKANEA